MTRGCGPTAVLAVDDDHDQLERYEHHLGEEYQVRTAADGETALEVVSDETDVVLLDRDAPGIAADELLARIRETAYDCRVAIVTANESDEDVVNVGYEGCLTKPFSEPELTTVVDRLCRIGDYIDAVGDFHDACERRPNCRTDAATGEDDSSIDECITHLRERVDEIAAEFDDEDYRVVFRDLRNAP